MYGRRAERSTCQLQDAPEGWVHACDTRHKRDVGERVSVGRLIHHQLNKKRDSVRAQLRRTGNGMCGSKPVCGTSYLFINCECGPSSVSMYFVFDSADESAHRDRSIVVSERKKERKKRAKTPSIQSASQRLLPGKYVLLFSFVGTLNVRSRWGRPIICC